MATDKSITILFYHNYRRIQLEGYEYNQVALNTWRCWKRFCSWCFEQGIGTPLDFQSGWGIELQEA